MGEMRARLVGGLSGALLLGIGCSVASDPSSGGVGGDGSGGAAACMVDACPGEDGDCAVRGCDGSGECMMLFAEVGAACAEDGGSVCDGKGSCVPSCSDATDCDDGGRCQDGICVPSKPNGEACASGDECQSGFCPAQDGVCCDSACDATCEACRGAKTGGEDGACALVSGGSDPDGECGDEGAASCGVNATGCSGTAPACNVYPSGTVCAAGSCSGSTATGESTCDDSGSCVTGEQAECAPYTCDSGMGACRSTCDGDNDCTVGNACISGKCLPKCDLVSVAAPVDHVSFGSAFGQWGADPAETLGAGKLWSIDGSSGTTNLQQFADLNAFKAQTSEASFNMSPERDGTGAVFYKGHVYFNEADTRNMVKYDIANQTAALTKELPNAGYRNTYDYQWGGYSDIDFAVDEHGLWVIYGTPQNSGRIVVSKLDEDLNILQTWNTTRQKDTSGNAFMVCGKLYVTASYDASSTTIDYKYDTATSTAVNPGIPFQNPGKYNSMIAYNPKEKRLYSWDNKRHQTYEVTIQQ